MKKIRHLLWLALALALPITSQAEESVEAQFKALCTKVIQSEQVNSEVKHFTLPEVMQVLKEEGYQVSDLKEDSFTIKINGRNIKMFYFKDGDLQLYYGISGVKVGYKELNDWNRTKRLSRAYLDKENDPVLESDLDGAKGLTHNQIAYFTKVFVDTSVPAYRNFLLLKGDVVDE